MQLLSTILNTRFWLMAMGAFLVLFTGFALVSGQAANSASTFWAGELTERELNIAVVVEVVWFAHMLGILLFLGLLAANPARARIGAIAVVAVMGTQFIAGGMASTYGYNGFSGFNIFAALFMLIPLITLIACLSKLNAK